MASCSTPEAPSLGLLIHFVRTGLIRHLERALVESGHDLNFSQFRVLKALSACERITLSELAREVDHDAGALTRMLDRLQEKGYVRRKPRDDDRRVVDICLTEAGRALWVSIRKSADGVSELAQSDLSAAERDQLLNLLKRVQQTLDQVPPENIA